MAGWILFPMHVLSAVFLSTQSTSWPRMSSRFNSSSYGHYPALSAPVISLHSDLVNPSSIISIVLFFSVVELNRHSLLQSMHMAEILLQCA